MKRIDLIASWTGVAPDRDGKSLAQKLSDVLNGLPVSGKDGFVWIAKNGAVRTTHQAFTVQKLRSFIIPSIRRAQLRNDSLTTPETLRIDYKRVGYCS
ncbi:MAG: hypothetical protein ABR903_03980, partial [Thermodesulfovibrionales bacterium]